MKAQIGLEYIGLREAQRDRFLGALYGAASGDYAGRSPSEVRKPWVAEIVGLDEKFGFERKFLKRSSTQYKRASGSFNRGAEWWFTLESGRIYEISYYTSWRSRNRYFCIVDDDGEIKEVSAEWVRLELASMS